MSKHTKARYAHSYTGKKYHSTMFLRACLSFASPSYFSPAAALHLRRATVVSVSSSSLQPSPNKQQRRSFAGSSNKYDIKKVGVVGLGLMGHGIGLVSAQAGYEVIAVEAQAAALESGKKRMDASLTKLLSKAVEKGKMTKEAAELEKKAVEGRITYSLDVKSLKDVDLVVEAIVENLGEETNIMVGRKLDGESWDG